MSNIKQLRKQIALLNRNNDDSHNDHKIEVLLYELNVLVQKKQNINKQALKLAHKIKPAYSSFRVALLTAYKVIKSKEAARKVCNGLVKAAVLTSKLGFFEKSKRINAACIAVWNLDYLD